MKRVEAASEAASAAWHQKATAAAEALVVAFTTAPQTVLGICAQILKKGRDNEPSQGAKQFLSDILALPSQPGVPGTSSVAADVMLSRPEVRRWMINYVEGLKRGKHLLIPCKLISCKPILCKLSPL